MQHKPLPIFPGANLKALPPPEWLVESFIQKGSLVMLYGASGVGKSFIALDMCLSIAEGKPWLDTYACEKGQTLYLPFEGLIGLGQRLVAWERYYGLADTPSGFWYSDRFESLQHPAPVRELMQGTLDTMPEPPKLVIIDTLSRAMLGAEENSAKDANLAMSNIDWLRKQTGCAVMLLHHTTKNTDYERGSTAIRAACDTALLLKQDDAVLQLTVDKQRDADPGKPIKMNLAASGDSVVPVLGSPDPNAMTPELELMIECFFAVQEGSDPVSGRAWMAQCADRGISEAVFKRRIAALVRSEKFTRVGSYHRPTYMPDKL